MNAELFSANELKILKKSFAKLESVNPDRLPEFHAMFDRMADVVLTQVVKADIKWLSSLARNEARNRGIKII